MAGGNSYNGWPASDSPSAIGIDKGFGASVGAPGFGSGGYVGGLKAGDVATVFSYLIGRLDREVEAMMDGDNGENGYGCWGYSYRANVNNPSQLSCHASGTAIDYNAPRHANGTSTGPNGGGGWTGAQYNAIQAILNGPLQGCIRWLTSNDPMHFEIYGNASMVAGVAASLGGSVPPSTDWFDTVTKDEMQAMLDATIGPLKDQVDYLYRNEVIEGQPFSKTAANFNDVRAMAEGVAHLRIITVYNDVSPIGLALDGPTGVVGLNDQNEADLVAAVIDEDTVANTLQVDVYNQVLARGVR